MANLLRLIFEKIERDEYERLIAEGKDPVELLHYKYQDVPGDIINKVIAIDPTKKKSYSQWLLSHWNDESDTIMKNLVNGRIDKLFQHYKNHQDIQIKDCPSVQKGLDAFVPEEDTVLTKSNEPTTYVENLGKDVDSELANDFDIVFNQDGWLIAVPNTYEAECKLGENMKWCTANAFGNGRNYYDRYLSEYGGKYYVNFDMNRGESRNGKDYPFTRYQFHFESNQFMDKEDDPVELSEIDLPESAMEFYNDEGYDASKFENLEDRIEHYEEQRYGYSYNINNDLCLLPEYNNDYEFQEPDENTSFYVYSVDDDRDPISWEEVPNPHVNKDVIQVKDEDYVILKSTYADNFVLAINENSGSFSRFRSNNWTAYLVSKYLPLTDGYGVFGVYECNYTHFTTDGPEQFKKMNVRDCESIFLNELCTRKDEGKWGRVFIEAVCDGYHSLFAIDNSHAIEWLIRRDVPANGEMYDMDENGYVVGKYSKYIAYRDENSLDEQPQYQLEKILDNGDYVITMENAEGNEVKNIMRHDTRKVVLSEWVNDILEVLCGLYVAKKGISFGYFTPDGAQIGLWYENYGRIDVENGLVGGLIRKEGKVFHIISGPEQKIIAEFAGFVGIHPVDGKIIVICEDGFSRGYDYMKRQMCYPQFEYMKRLVDTNSRYFWCKLTGKDEYVIFDFSEQRISAGGVAGIKKAGGNGCGEMFTIQKLNGKFNVFGQVDREGQDINYYQLLDHDVDEIISVENFQKFIIYQDAGRYYAYDYLHRMMLVNPDGTDIPAKLDSYGYLTYDDGRTTISFYMNRPKKWTCVGPTGRYSGDFINQLIPDDVTILYNKLTKGVNQVSESFHRFMKRIDEARKLTMNEIVL